MLKTLRAEAGITLMELILAAVIFAILAPGILLVFNKGMESFFFERDELVVQSDIRNTMDRMTDKLRDATSVTTAEPTNIVFDPDSRRYYWDSQNKNVYDGDGNQLNSQEIEVIDFSFSYYGEDMVNPLSFPVDASEVKAVGIKMKFKANDKPALELESWVLIRNSL